MLKLALNIVSLFYFYFSAAIQIGPKRRTKNFGGYGGIYLVFVSSRSVKMRGFSFLSLYKSLFIFQFLNVKMYNYGKQNTIVNFIIKKLNKTQFHQKV